MAQFGNDATYSKIKKAAFETAFYLISD